MPEPSILCEIAHVSRSFGGALAGRRFASPASSIENR